VEEILEKAYAHLPEKVSSGVRIMALHPFITSLASVTWPWMLATVGVSC
jgi:hypothetical protein